MDQQYNGIGQPIGFSIPNWQEKRRPPRTAMIGDYCRIEPLDPNVHAESLYRVYAEDKDHRNWTYLPYGPFPGIDEFRAWLEKDCLGDDPLFHSVVDAQTGQAVGMVSFLRIEPRVGVIEVGHIHYSPRLQKTPMATEAMFLMMCRVFDELGYRRFEWKCDALNERSRAAAQRLGFSYEGVFRQATIYKGRNRDTAWYAIIDKEWPRLREIYRKWLDPSNFNAHGRQIESLTALSG